MMMKPVPRFAQTRTEYLPFAGGWDIVTPALKIPPGFARVAQNFEQSINGGYATILGYERLDGRPKPSSAAYAVLSANITGAYAVGNTLTGATSGATGVILAATATSFVLTKIAGTFQAAENLTIGGTVRAVSGGAQVVDGASTVLLHAQYKNLAADSYRADIAAIPGSGIVRGVVLYNDVWYGFRDTAPGTAGAIYKSTSSGWSAVPLGRELAFTSGGTYQVVEGNTVRGITSGATGVVARVVLLSGTWAGGTAAGRFIFSSQTGTFQAEDLEIPLGAANVGTIAGNSSAITLAPGGRYEFVLRNFGGMINTKRIYGCDGQNRGFEFDGTTYVPITTGMATDTPRHVGVHKNQLFFSFGASAQHSGTGTPYIWAVILGAGEIAVGDTITGFMSQSGSQDSGALLIASRNSLHILYGTGVSTWNLAQYEEEAGALEYSLQRIGITLMVDDRGLTSLATTQAFGNFASATLSRRIQTWLTTQRTKIKSSCTVKDKNQYRIFFSDGYALFVTMEGAKVLGMLPQYFPDIAECVWAGEMNDGSEAICFGSADGYVYQMERGTSFDGDDIEFFLDLAWNHSKSPRLIKQYKHCMFEVAGDGYAAFNFGYEFGYATSEIYQPGVTEITTGFSAGTWDSGTWDVGVWDGSALMPTEMPMDGAAENVSLKIRGRSDYYSPLTFSGAIVNYIPRRSLR